MRTIGAFDAKNRLGTLLDLVEQGEEITITRHGKPVARLVAPGTSPGSAESRPAADRIRARREGVMLGGIPVKSLIEDGRK